MSELEVNSVKNLSKQSGLILGDSKIDVQVGGVKVGEFNADGFQGLENVAIFADIKANGVNGGTFTSGDWRTRDLSSTPILNNISGCSISSNTITLPAGTYYVRARANAVAVDVHKARITNISDSVDLLIGTSERSANSNTVQNASIVEGTFTIANSKNIQLQHRCQTTVATVGFGTATSVSGGIIPEVYSQIYIKKLA